MSKKCLVIGANGFIGSHLVEGLSKKGFMVRAFDRFTRTRQFSESDNIEIFKGDFFDNEKMDKSLKGVDYLFHCYSSTTPSTADTDPYTDISSNVQRNVQLFERSVKHNVKKIIFISSGGAVYGTLAETKKAAETDAPQPVSPYGIGKLTSEYYLAYFKRSHGLDYVAYRLSNPYGPGQITKNNQGVIPSFIENLYKGKELFVMGDGTSTRDYIYIGDAVSAITRSFLQAKHNIYNLGSGKQTSINEIINHLKELMMKEPTVRYIEEPKTFLRHSQIDIGLFNKDFGKSSTTELAKGLALTIVASNNH